MEGKVLVDEGYVLIFPQQNGDVSGTYALLDKFGDVADQQVECLPVVVGFFLVVVFVFLQDFYADIALALFVGKFFLGYVAVGFAQPCPVGFCGAVAVVFVHCLDSFLEEGFS